MAIEILNPLEILSDLSMQARDFMFQQGFHYDGEFDETSGEEQYKFAGRDGDEREHCWLKCAILDKNPDNPGLQITFGSFHNDLPSQISRTFFSGRESISSEETEHFKKRVEEQRKKAAERKKNEKDRENRILDFVRRRYESASQTGKSPYFERKCIVPPEDIRFETHTYFEGNCPHEETVALIPLRNNLGELVALQEIYPSKQTFSDKEPRDKNSIGKYAGCSYTFGIPKDGSKIYIGEGFATTGTGHSADGVPSVMAITCGNLLSVGKQIKEKFPNSEISILGDLDKNGLKNPQAIKAAEVLGCKVVFPFFSPGKDRDKDGKVFTDFNDLFVSEGIDVVREQFKIAEETSFVRPNKATRFLVEPGQTHIVADKGTEILSDPECGVFQQQGRVVRIVEFETKAKKKKDRFKRPSGALTIELCEEIHLIDALNKKSGWEKFDARSKQNRPIDFPDKAAKMILSRKGKDLPFLKGFICCPTIREDGSLLETPGYDEETGLFFNPCGTVFPEIPENPTQEDAKKALGILIDLINDFPFADDVSRSVALAEMMTSVIRRSLDLSPLFANDASTRSSGKTLLAKQSSYISTGKEPTMIIPVPNEDEMGKRIGAAFMGGDSVICIDNIDFPFESRDLCVTTTASVFNPRILGQSKSPDVATNSLVILTGNNLVLRGDICSRVLKCRLLPNCENPEERKFERNLEEYTPKNRGELVGAILTIMRAYISAGLPGLRDLSGFRTFSNWTKFVAGPLVWLGEKDPYESAREIKENDPEKEEIGALFASWHAAMKHLLFESNTVTVKHLLIALENRREEYEEIQNFYDVLLEFSPNKHGLIDAKILGNKLRKLKGRIVDGYRLEVAGKDRTNAVLWKISKMGA